MLAIALAAASLPAQEAEGTGRKADGIRLIYGPTLAKPYLGNAARAPFEGLGDDFQPGLGIRAGLGYGSSGVELIGTAEYAGLDVGDPFERDGIPMGRRSSILRGYTLTAWWTPAAGEFAGWRARVGGGYLAGGLDNVSMRPDQLSGVPLELARTVESGNAPHPTGISGSGFRLGAGAERDFSPTLAAQLHLELDRMSLDEFLYARERFAYDGGGGWVARLAAVLRWAP